MTITSKSTEQSKLTVEEIFEVFPDLVFVLNDEYIITEFKAGNEQDLYLPPSQFLGKSMLEVMPADASEKLLEGIERAKSDGNVHSVEYRLIINDVMKWFEARVRKSLDERLVFLVRDITEQKSKEKHILYQATHDHLTGLYNRAFSFNYLEQKLKESSRQHSKVVVFYIDLNEFKSVNDNFGHDAGDNVLIAVAKVLKASFRQEDLISRIGGDEFLVAFSGEFNSEELNEMIKKVHTNLTTHPFNGIGNRLVTASIGVAICSDGNKSVSELLKKADIEMYQHKYEYKLKFDES